MPELPEVETIRRSLQKAIVGKTVKDIEVRKPKIFQGEKKEVIGRKIEGVERRGKILIIALGAVPNRARESQRAQKAISVPSKNSVSSVIGETSDTKLLLPEGTERVLLIHFKLTGQMVWVPKAGESVTLGHPIPFAGSELPAKTTHVIFEIDGGRLFFNDLRQFGWIKVVDVGEMGEVGELEKLGPEPFDKEFTLDYLKQVFLKTSKPIKLVLMDQGKIAGIGNIYANEVLFEAGVLPTKSAKILSEKDIKILRESIIKVLKEGLKYGGSSAKDEAYIKPTGEAGEYQKHFRVYQRAGQSCPCCKSKIEKVELGGRGTFFCPHCQK